MLRFLAPGRCRGPDPTASGPRSAAPPPAACDAPAPFAINSHDRSLGAQLPDTVAGGRGLLPYGHPARRPVGCPSRSLRITPHRPAQRAGADSGLGPALLPAARSAPAPAPRHLTLPRDDPLHALTRKNMRRTEHNTPPRQPAPGTALLHGQDETTSEQVSVQAISKRSQTHRPCGRPARRKGAGNSGGELRRETSDGQRGMPPAGALRLQDGGGTVRECRPVGSGDGELSSRPPSTQAEPSRHGTGRPGRSYSGALHLDARHRACSTMCGPTADGMRVRGRQ